MFKIDKFTKSGFRCVAKPSKNVWLIFDCKADEYYLQLQVSQT